MHLSAPLVQYSLWHLLALLVLYFLDHPLAPLVQYLLGHLVVPLVRYHLGHPSVQLVLRCLVHLLVPVVLRHLLAPPVQGSQVSHLDLVAQACHPFHLIHLVFHTCYLAGCCPLVVCLSPSLKLNKTQSCIHTYAYVCTYVRIYNIAYSLARFTHIGYLTHNCPCSMCREHLQYVCVRTLRVRCCLCHAYDGSKEKHCSFHSTSDWKNNVYDIKILMSLQHTCTYLHIRIYMHIEVY